MAEQGTVVRSSGSVYGVRTAAGTLIDCRVKGNFRLKGIRSTNPVAVGDHVRFDIREDGTAYIVDILERRNYIVRKASNLSKQSHILAANLDQCFLIVTISHPVTATTFIDRFLATAEAYRVPVVLVFNKTDLYNDTEREELEYLTALYENIGYRCMHTSVVDGVGVEELKEAMRGKVSLLAGNSGKILGVAVESRFHKSDHERLLPIYAIDDSVIDITRIAYVKLEIQCDVLL